MKCPHCFVSFHASWTKTSICEKFHLEWFTGHSICPSCDRLIIVLGQTAIGWGSNKEWMIYPKAPNRSFISQEIPESFAKDSREA
jgi:hypothetical protein